MHQSWSSVDPMVCSEKNWDVLKLRPFTNGILAKSLFCIFTSSVKKRAVEAPANRLLLRRITIWILERASEASCLLGRFLLLEVLKLIFASFCFAQEGTCEFADSEGCQQRYCRSTHTTPNKRLLVVRFQSCL